MPVILGPTPNRRDFLRAVALSAGAALAGGCAHFSAKRGRAQKAARWALLADTHVTLDAKEVHRGFNIDDNVKKVVAQIVEAAPEGAVIAGDIARLQGKPEDYRMVIQLMEPMISRMPVALVLGNHDHRDNFFKAFPKRAGQPAPIKNKHTFIIETADLRLLMLDSLLTVNETGGLLGKAQRQWLEKYLDQSDRRPTFLFLHHDLRDGDNSLLDADRFLKIILPRKQVKAVFYGHTHVYKYERIEGLHLINLPAVGYNFSDKEPLGWLDARLTAEGGDFTLRAFASNTKDNGKTTSLAWRG
jgi:3',5'-cyclic AMP phosphodiesterase CpdA